MENEIENSVLENESEISAYECLTKFREPLFNSIINSLNIPSESKGLDVACGIGAFSKILAETVGKNGHIIGLDISKDFIHYSKNHYQTDNNEFVEGDINSLQFNDDSFDWIWSVDTVWPGPQELGCPAEDPSQIIDEFYRVLKPGGALYLLYWSSQKILPGYPILEANLNTTSSGTAPFVKGMNPVNHVLNARYWLKKVGFSNISIKTYLSDIIGPLIDNDKNALNLLFQMLWGGSESEVSKKDWDEFKRLCDPNSKDYLPNDQYYYGFYTYTMISGIK